MEINLVSSPSFIMQASFDLRVCSVLQLLFFLCLFGGIVHKMTLDFCTTHGFTDYHCYSNSLLLLLKGISQFLEVFDLIEGKQQLVHTKSH